MSQSHNLEFTHLFAAINSHGEETECTVDVSISLDALDTITDGIELDPKLRTELYEKLSALIAEQITDTECIRVEGETLVNGRPAARAEFHEDDLFGE